MNRRNRWLISIAWTLGTLTLAAQLYNAVSVFVDPIHANETLIAKIVVDPFGLWNSLFSSLAILVGLWLVTVRPGWMTFCLSLALLNMGGSTHVSTSFSLAAQMTAGLISSMLTYQTFAPLFVIFALRFPDDRLPSWGIPLRNLALISVLLFEAYVIADSFTYIHVLQLPAWKDLLYNIVASTWVLAAAVIIVIRSISAPSNERAQLRWALIGAVLALANDAIGYINVGAAGGHAGSTFAWLGTTFMPVLPLCIAYTLMRKRYIDPVFVLNRATVFAVTGVILAFAIVVLDWTTERLLSESNLAFALQAIVTISLGLTMNRLHRRVEYSVERVLFRRRFEATQYLDELGRSLSIATRDSVVEEAVTREAARELNLTSAAIFRFDAERNAYMRGVHAGWGAEDARELAVDDTLARFLRVMHKPVRPADARWDRSDLPPGDAAPVLAIPMLVRGEVTGFVLYGPHRDRTMIDSSEEQDLEKLLDRACAALDHVEALTLRQALLRRA